MAVKLANPDDAGQHDPNQATATLSPVPSITVANKIAPAGPKGPHGTAPRTAYSRVNTGAPPTPDAGTEQQKASPPRGLENLPVRSKVAHVEKTMTTMMMRPQLQDLVKEAMEGAARKVDMHLSARSENVKTASAELNITPTDYINKLADALDYMAKEASEGADGIGPGEGPGALPVSAAKSSGQVLDAGRGGTATAKHVVPRNPPMQSSGVAKDAPTGMQDDMERMPSPQPVDPMHNEKVGSLVSRNMQRLGLKTASVLERNLARLGLTKVADDGEGGSPNISAGAAPAQGAEAPPGAAPAGEQVPSEPSDVNSQKNYISSNSAAIAYTKGQAKADPKRDLGHVLTEPALSRAHDSVLHQAFDATGRAGVKIASDLTRVAAAQALLRKYAEKAESEEEEKEEGKGHERDEKLVERGEKAEKRVDKAEKKEKDGAMSNMVTPKDASGFSAAG